MTAPLDEQEAWRLVLEVAELGSTHDWVAPSPLTPAAESVFDIYLPLLSRREIVIGQLGQSLDGRIATVEGASHYVTGAEDLDRLHRLRALADAVIVGANTVASDDPQLTVRRVEGVHPVRVVLDPAGRLDPGHRVFTDGAARTIVIHRATGDVPRSVSAGHDSVESIAVPATDEGNLDLGALLRMLRAQGLSRILVEGGGMTVSHFLQAGLLDRLHVTVAPMLIGSGVPSITLDPIPTLDTALRPVCRHFPLGQDLLFDLDLRAESA